MSRTGSAAKRSNKCKRDDSGPLHLLVQTIKHEEFQIQTPVISSHPKTAGVNFQIQSFELWRGAAAGVITFISFMPK